MEERSRRMRLGDILIEYGLITKEQLEEALRIQTKTKTKLGDTLINLGFLTKQNINEVLEFQLGIPYVNLREHLIEPDAIKLLTEAIVKKHKILPVRIRGNELYLAMEDPLNIYAIDDVALVTGKSVIPMFTSEEFILEAIDIYYGKEKAMAAAEQYQQEYKLELFQDEDTPLYTEDIKNAPIVKIVNTIIDQAIRYRASDIHLEPFEKKIKVRYRIDGRLKEMMEYDISLISAITARIKITGGMDISEKRKPQDGRLTVRVDQKSYDIRVSILPTVYGEKIVLRISFKDGLTKKKEHLGLVNADLERFNRILSNPHGIILVTGPTGSGKSTTLYTALSELNAEDVNIITVEDPVEANIEGVNQVQVNVKAGLTFESALRSILRQDPDIIMIGEIRDAETAEIAVKASITGHLVVSTLHTNSAASTVARLIDMGIEPYLIGASLVGIIAQRLVRRLCPKCKESYLSEPYHNALLGINDPITLYRAKGCHLCGETGYQGRIGIYELMEISSRLRVAINQEKTVDEIKAIATEEGMKPLKNNGVELVLSGITSVEELLKIAYTID